MSTLGVGGAPGMYTGIYTDFRSEAPDLLGAVMQKRNMDLQERQVKVNQDAQKLRRDMFTDSVDTRRAKNLADKKTVIDEAKDAIYNKNQEEQFRQRDAFVKGQDSLWDYFSNPNFSFGTYLDSWAWNDDVQKNALEDEFARRTGSLKKPEVDFLEDPDAPINVPAQIRRIGRLHGSTGAQLQQGILGGLLNWSPTKPF